MAVKKATAKSKRKVVKKKTVSKPVAKKGTMPTVKDPLSKGGIIKALMDMTGLPKKDVAGVLDNLHTLIELHIRSRGPGKFVMPGMLKINVVKKPARPARKGINPFTGEEVMFKAKPAMRVVKIKALKKLKEIAA
ncbi:MAG: HU family DNA-binding protein [Gammaproteobacteria bacterium]